ncbi:MULTISPECIES: Pvc16 family protein [unclassified Burkholderia]|uniref:Pvc16 family protein n=1 Tax=unclassified Burkholderia TaxID=2613784 RepID=UPI0014220CA6|nr:MULTISPECIES: Pvc16 family protein [unclassified Burkholderia]NIE58654.1 DUF4255 domain-containing protein [Burkholderia sp. Ap-955]NIF10145.1 DUF4255 domain-containing protein [Burkholderia sp. Ax-1735]NIG03596.1 DUF4255 domain-containing protein [Burkholderia sp. Tr-849]
MIDDLSRTLQAILVKSAPAPLKDILLTFDRPDDSFDPQHTTLNLFLYDLRENLELRSNELTIEKLNNQSVTHKAPMRLDCSYLATAWPVGGADLAMQEQLLLAQTLQTFGRFPTIPANFLQGALRIQEPALPMVALHPDAVKNLAEFWTSLGTRLRASLTVTVTISVPLLDDVPDYLVTTMTTGTLPVAGAPPDALIQIGGQVHDALGAGVPDALVDLLDVGLRTKTDGDGNFVLSGVPAGLHTLRVTAVGFQSDTRGVVVPGPLLECQVTLAPL